MTTLRVSPEMKLPAKVILRVGPYALSIYDQANFWLQKDTGEGMNLSRRRLEEILHKHFEDNF